MRMRTSIQLGALLAAAALGASPAGATRLSAAGAFATQARWDLAQVCQRDAKPRQTLSGAWAQLEFGSGLSAHVEVASVNASDGDVRLEAGDGIAASAMLMIEPSDGHWRVQVGAGTPSGGELTAEDRELLRLLDEPALRYPLTEMARGWQFHLGALGGFALRRGLDLYGGVAADQPLAYDVMPGSRIEPGSRLSVSAGLSAGGQRRGGDLRIVLAFDNRQRLDGEEICSGRTDWGASAAGHATWRALRFEVAAGLDLSGSVRWPSAVAPEVPPLRSDPGRLGDVSLGLGMDRGAQLGLGWSVRPALSVTHRRFEPADLPYGDGWSRTITPALELARGPLLLAVGAGWGTGGWRPWCGESRGPRREIEGGQLHVAIEWLPDPSAGQGRRSVR